MAAGNRRRRLDARLRDELPLSFEGWILSVDYAIADALGKVVARSDAAGRRISAIGALIAATAEVHGLTLVTRNELDFEPILKTIMNTWTES